jgi:hypothetical protein
MAQGRNVQKKEAWPPGNTNVVLGTPLQRPQMKNSPKEDQLHSLPSYAKGLPSLKLGSGCGTGRAKRRKSPSAGSGL